MASSTGSRKASLNREGRPGGLIGVNPRMPMVLYNRRTRSTVAVPQPRSSAIDALDRPASDIRIMVQLRNTAALGVFIRSVSNASTCSSESRFLHMLGMATSRRLRRHKPCRHNGNAWINHYGKSLSMLKCFLRAFRTMFAPAIGGRNGGA